MSHRRLTPQGSSVFSTTKSFYRCCQFSLTQATTKFAWRRSSGKLNDDDSVQEAYILLTDITNCYIDSNKEIQGLINDEWKSNPLCDSIHGEMGRGALSPIMHHQHKDWDWGLSRWTELYVLSSQNICVCSLHFKRARRENGFAFWA